MPNFTPQFFISCIICFSWLSSKIQCSGVPIVGHFTENDRLRLKEFFNQNARTATDSGKLYYSLSGLITLEETVNNPNNFCETFSRDISTPEYAFYHAYGNKYLPKSTCNLKRKAIETLVESKLAGSPSIDDLFYGVLAMGYIGSSVDDSLVLKHLNRIKMKDSSPLTMGRAFQVVASLNVSKSELSPYLAAIGDVLNQADEYDGQLLYFERGLYTTAVVAQGLSDLITASGDVNVVPHDKLIKLINFLYKRLHSSNLRASAHLLSSLKSLATNKYLAPVVIFSHMGPATAGELYHGQPKLRLHLVDMWTAETYSPEKLRLKAGGLYEVQVSDTTRKLVGPAERGIFATIDKTDFQLSLDASPGLPAKGQYELEVSATWAKSSDKRLPLGVSQVTLPVRVLAEASIIDPALAIVDTTNDRQLADIRLTPGKVYKSSTPNGAIELEVGFQLSFFLRLVDASNPALPLTAHQVFMQLTHRETAQAITFTLAEVPAIGVDNAKAYKVHLEPESSAADFDYLDGIYKMEILVGDFFLHKPIIWHVADLDLRFGGVPGSDSASRSTQASDISRREFPTAAALKRAPGPNPLIGTGPTTRKPEIEHMFRAPEKRASRIVALLFTGLCAIPFVGLLIAWALLGVNMRNFRFRLSNILFHSGLIAIFALYLTYWCYLDMFTTLGYLAVLGVPTFFAAHTALRAHLVARLGVKK